ncbi:unnamed protein product [Strongylus vulgaris]|uniref:SCP domain-containing protein n=1 Tax=Strongylus vulgaris TaxID=40348 RepID=A0A3P7IV50_STRVU|nr:unnamed protein product [Strongylus vulgaris]
MLCLIILTKTQFLVNRAKLAQGKVADSNGGYLKPASLMYALKWDCELESAAYIHATACSLQMSAPSTRPGIGENIFTASNRDLNHITMAELATQIWWTVPTKFNLNNTRYMEMDADLFPAWSQAVWSETSRVGCYSYACPNGRFLVCRYAEGGNIIGKSIYRIGVLCSTCTHFCVDDSSSVYYGLCVTSD